MKKVLLTILTVCSVHTLTAQNSRLLDQPMQIKNMTIKVDADCFAATTFLEIEFYNPNDKEIEGLYRFSLLPGQVIAGFQLELNGRYRDGSIEEKWKARAAYNTIVGKRVDPALLSLEWENNYRLNIYPVPAKGSRKVTITIQQLLKEEKGRLWYRFALNKKDTAGKLMVNIKTTGCAYPSADDGFVANEIFQSSAGFYELNKSGENIPLWQGINFSFPLNSAPLFCTQTKNDQNYFALRVHYEVPSSLPIYLKKLLVYWDVSFSSSRRNLEKEISFLRKLLLKHQTEELTIVAFGDQTWPAKTFHPQQSISWIDYLQGMQYDGATRLDILNLAGQGVDAIFLFSDGYATYGSKLSGLPFKPLFAVSSSVTKDSSYLKALIGNSGGAFIDLGKYSVASAIEKATVTSNQLLTVQSSSGKTVFEKTNGKSDFILYGTLPQNDTLSFIYGTSSQRYRTEKIVLQNEGGCPATGIDRLPMLYRFASLNQWYDWEEVLEFGLKERIVTHNTSYIVLEKTEDYIKYNIAPPKELEEECAQKGYITKSTKTWRQQLKERDTYDVLNTVVSAYNDKMKQWDASAPGINLSRVEFEKINTSNASVVQNDISSSLQGRIPGLNVSNNMEEVVVVGYGAAARRSLSYSVTTVQANAISGNTIEQALSGKVAGLTVSPSQGFLGDASSVRIRGISSFSNNQPLYVLDGFPFNGNINDIVSVNDIESITVLKDAAGTAIYGSRASNGAIVITTKKYRPYYRGYAYNKPYKLKDMEDEDYLQDIKAIAVSDKLQLYYTLRKHNINNASFYLDMARHFFESGLKADAGKIILNAAEVSNGNSSVLLAIAYIFEEWKQFHKAIEVYKQVLSIQPVIYRRTAAWHGRFIKAGV
jgi:TonB-dependent SusC/RagA subfamily outer membrane receptor